MSKPADNPGIGTADDEITFEPDSGLIPNSAHTSLAWTQDRLDRPYITHHAQQRWDERTPWWSRSVEYAYTAGVPVFEFDEMVFRDGDGNAPDRVRIFGESTDRGTYGVLMFIVDGSLTTVYPLSKSFLSKPVKAYLWEVLHQQGHLERGSAPHDGRQNE